MNAFLTQRIESRKQKIETLIRQIGDLRRQRREIEAELRAYLDVQSNANKTEFTASSNSETDAVNINNPKSTRMSDTWRNILREFCKRYPHSSHVDEIRTFVGGLGKEMSDESLRSQLSIYTKNGWLERTGVGQYRITSQGAFQVDEVIFSADTDSEDNQTFD